MKKIMFLFLIINLSWAINYSPSNPQVGQTVTFSLTFPSYFSISNCSATWNFGDGSPTLTTDPYNSVTHVYNSPGTYTVTVSPSSCLTTPPPPETTTVTVSAPNIFISVQYSVRPWPGYPVHFTLMNAPTGYSVSWDFGDGLITSGTSSVSHTYTNPGTYKVIATVNMATAKVSATTVVIIQPDPRQVTWSPQIPKSGQVIVFQALNFVSNNILWDFGNGVTRIGPPVIKYIYRKHGIYTVKVMDMAGNDLKQFTYMLTVKPGEGAYIGLAIHSIELLFENNNKGYIVVPFKYTNLRAKARIRYEGSGVLAGFWTVDDVPFASFNKTLIFRGETELKLSGLPAISPGLHTVSLRITHPELYPELDVSIPVIRYYVSAIENRITITSPENGDLFFVDQKIRLTWNTIPQISKYTLVYGNSAEEVFSGRGKKLPLNNTGMQELTLHAGQYYIKIIGENQDGVPLYFSDIVGFQVIETPIRIKVGAFKNIEEGTVTREKLKRGKFYNLGINVKILKGGPYLIRTYFNGKKINEEWIPKDEQFYRTTVKAENGILEIRIYRVFKGKLRIVIFRSIKIVVQ